MPAPARKLALAESPVSFQTDGNTIAFEYDSLEEAFPAVDPGRAPVGHNILVQVRQPKTHTKGGILLTTEARSTEYYNTRVAKVVALGPICFTSTHTDRDGDAAFKSHLVDWPEGKWFSVGDYVEIPQYGGSRFVVSYQTKREEYDPDERRMVPKTVTENVTFAFFKAKDIIAKITADPRTIKAYTD